MKHPDPANGPTRFLGLDLGSTYIKGGVLDLETLTIRHVERVPFPEPLKGLDPSFREFDPQEILNLTRRLLETLHRHAPDADGIVICNQMHSLVFVAPGGQPASNLVSWQDQRALTVNPGSGTRSFDDLRARLTPEDWRQLGNEPRPGVPLSFLFWLKKKDHLPTSTVVVGSLPSLVVSNLCDSPPSVDLTNAHSYGTLNVETLDWHHGIIGKLGLERLQWPTIVQQGAVLGETQIGSKRLRVHAPIGDFQCSQVGAFIEDDELSINISTGSGVLRLSPKLEFGDFQTRPFFDRRWARVITHIPGGRALSALVTILTELARAEGISLRDPWDYIMAEADKVSATDLRLDPAFYFGAMGECGSLTHIREENLTVGHLFRAAFEGMAENYAKSARRISPAADWSRVVFSGGVALKAWPLRRLITRRLGQTHRLAASGEDSLLGLMTCALSFGNHAESMAEAMACVRTHYKAIQ